MGSTNLDIMPASQQYASVFERKEKKYILSPAQHSQLMELIGDMLIDDEYAQSTISSLYYDTPQFDMINRSIEKPLYKEKLRVRAYGSVSEESPVFVELKKKFKGIVYKRRIKMSEPGSSSYLLGSSYADAGACFPLPDSEADGNSLQNVREIDACLARHGTLTPAIMIIVKRHSLRSTDESNIRFTFDWDARWRTTNLRLGTNMTGTPLFSEGQIIMEIKALGAYPLWLVHALNSVGAYPQSCSKVGKAYEAYMRSRKVTDGNSLPQQFRNAHPFEKEESCA